MDLIEKKTRLLTIKKEITRISSEWYNIEKELDSKFIYTDEFVRHVRVLYDYLSDLVAELTDYKQDLRDYYIVSIKAIANRMRTILNGHSGKLTPFISL